MPHSKFNSNRMDSSAEEDVLVSYAEIGGRPLSHPYRGPITMQKSPSIMFSSRCGGADPEVEHNMTRPNCPNASYKFDSKRTDSSEEEDLVFYAKMGDAH